MEDKNIDMIDEYLNATLSILGSAGVGIFGVATAYAVKNLDIASASIYGLAASINLYLGYKATEKFVDFIGYLRKKKTVNFKNL